MIYLSIVAPDRTTGEDRSGVGIGSIAVIIGRLEVLLPTQIMPGCSVLLAQCLQPEKSLPLIGGGPLR
jgi:hypothetical protein